MDQGRIRILIVDDESAVRGLLNEILRDQGFNCDSCDSGQQALNCLREAEFDLVISDMNMPGMNGLELLAAVRQQFPSSAFIVLTGEGDVRIGVEAIKLGAADYVVKPFQIEPLLAAITRALEKKRLEMEVKHYRKHLEELVEQRTRQLQSALKRIEGTYEETLQALGGALDLRDNDTAGHSQRVTRYTLEIAQVLGCNADELTQIIRGAYLHDIGKIGIPDGILLKRDKLSIEELEVMRQHVRIGYDLVSRISFLAGAAEIVLTHQECFDGTGYPQGLVGSEIPLGSRIFAVADTLDAMTSDRPYRRALPFSSAHQEIERLSGKQFDPEVVHAFLSFPVEAWEGFRREVSAELAVSKHILLRPGHRPGKNGSAGVSFAKLPRD